MLVTHSPLRRSLGLGAEGDKAAAKAHFEAATRLYDVQEFAKALEEYKAAYLAKPDPAFLFNIGQCYRKLGKPEQALEFYRNYLKKAAPDDPNRANVEARIRETASEVPIEAVPPPRLEAPPAADGASGTTLPAPTPASPAVPQPAGVDLTAPAPAPQSPGSSPFYAKWWFWTGVGAVVVAGTVTAIVVASGGSKVNSASPTLGTRAVFQ